MDLSTIIGLIAGFALILMSILTGGGNLASYINIPSVLMTIGGSFAAIMVANPLSRVLGMMKYVKRSEERRVGQECRSRV